MLSIIQYIFGKTILLKDKLYKMVFKIKQLQYY